MKFLLSLLLLYCVACLALYLLQRNVLYFPHASADERSAYVQKLSFHSGDQALSGWVVAPGQSKALIYYGGNAENIIYNVEFFRAVAAQYSVYLMPYRGYGDNSGQPSEEALYQDALALFDRIKDDHASISLMGRSLGSGVATYVAAQRQINQLILVTPFDSIENVAKEVYWMFPIALLIKDRYPSAERVEAIDAATLILVAENDQVIARTRSDALIKAFAGKQATAVLIDGAGHNNISQYRQYVSAITSWLH